MSLSLVGPTLLLLLPLKLWHKRAKGLRNKSTSWYSVKKRCIKMEKVDPWGNNN